MRKPRSASSLSIRKVTDARRSNGNGGAVSTGDSTSDATGDSIDSAIDDGSGAAGASGAAGDFDGIGDLELPVRDKRRSKRDRDIEGRDSVEDSERNGGAGNGRRRRSNRSNTGPDTGSAGAEERAPSDRGIFPREIALDSLGNSSKKSEKKDTKLSAEFIAEGFGIVFAGAAALLNDEEWKLPEEDAQELAERTARWMRQGTKNIAAFEKRMARLEPAIMLVLGFLAVVIPRVIHTRDKRRAIRLQKEARTGNETASAAPSSSVPDFRSGNDAAGERNGDTGPDASGGIPKRRKTWAQAFGSDD